MKKIWWARGDKFLIWLLLYGCFLAENRVGDGEKKIKILLNLLISVNYKKKT